MDECDKVLVVEEKWWEYGHNVEKLGVFKDYNKAFDSAIKARRHNGVWKITEYWLDENRPEDYNKCRLHFEQYEDIAILISYLVNVHHIGRIEDMAKVAQLSGLYPDKKRTILNINEKVDGWKKDGSETDRVFKGATLVSLNRSYSLPESFRHLIDKAVVKFKKKAK